MTDSITWGSGNEQVTLNARLVEVRSDEQVIPGTRTNNPEMDRQTRKGVPSARFSDFSGGQTRVAGIGDARSDLNKAAVNQGLWTITPGLLYPTYLPTIQTSITNEADHSTDITINRRLHSTLSNLGVTGLRWIGGLGTQILGDTSLTDPTIVVRKTLTDSITAICQTRANNVDYLMVCTNGSTDDIRGFTSVSGSGALSPDPGTLLIALSSGDAIWAAQYFPSVGKGLTVLLGKIGGVNGAWWFLSDASLPITPRPLVYDEGKGTVGNVAISDTGYFAPTRTLDTHVNTNDNQTFASDNSYGTSASTNGSAWAWAGWAIPTTSPREAPVTGLLFEVEQKESNADDNLDTFAVRLMLGPLDYQVGVTEGDKVGGVKTSATELSTSDAFTVFGTSIDTWLLNMTMGDLMGGDFWVRYDARDTSGITVLLSIDSVRMKVYFQETGTQAVFHEGGYRGNPMPNFPNRMVYHQPAVDDKTAITVPRQPVYLDIAWDEGSARPTLQQSIPDTSSMAGVWHGTPYAGGNAFAGGDSTGPGSMVVLVKEDGKAVNTRFPAFMGSTQLKVNALFTCGGFLCAQVVPAGYTDLQYWLLDPTTNQWHAVFLLQSLTATAIAVQPIPYAETVLNLQQNRIYSAWYESSHLRVRREFMPPDPNADPRVTNTTETKFAGAAYLQTMEMYVGYPEASNTILSLDYQERRIGDASSATGTVRMQISTSGDATFSSPEVNPSAFSTGLSATVATRGHYDIPGGQPYQTQIARITIDQGGGTTTSGPNGLSWLETTAQDWPSALRTFDFQLEADTDPSHSIDTLVRDLNALKTKKNVQHLKGGDVDCLAVYDRPMSYDEWVGQRGTLGIPANITKGQPIIRFIEKPGSIT